MVITSDPERANRLDDFIVGVDSRSLPWVPCTVRGFNTGAEQRLLSRDQHGRCSLVVRAEPGWVAGNPGFFTSEAEIVVLRGSLEMNEDILGRYSYTAVPAGMPVHRLSAEYGARFLLFLNDPAGEFLVQGSPDAEWDRAGNVPPVNLFDLSWKAPYTPGLAPGILTKLLREHPASTARTWVTGMLHWGREISAWEEHPTAEEAYVLEGRITNTERLSSGVATHVYNPGGYFHRPPRVLHSGPGSWVDAYAMILFRSPKRLETRWRDGSAPS